MAYTTSVRVRFAQVDAAQIVFFPRYVEWLQGAIEDYMAEHVGCDVNRLMREYNLGMPAVHVEIDYFVPSRLWDNLEISLSVEKIGRSSLPITATFHVGEEVRARLSIIVVCTNMQEMKSVPWPEDLRARLLT
ncbi:MAG: thioesterase family protein [Asticcacaulis sp.]